MLLRKPTRIELKPEDKEVRLPKRTCHEMPCCDAEHMPKLQYENVKKAQAEAQARQPGGSWTAAKVESAAAGKGLLVRACIQED